MFILIISLNLIILTNLLITGPAITGRFFVSSENFSTPVNEVYTSNSSYVLNIAESQPYNLKSVKISGNFSGEGQAKVLLKTASGTFIVFDSVNLLRNKATDLATGLFTDVTGSSASSSDSGGEPAQLESQSPSDASSALKSIAVAADTISADNNGEGTPMEQLSPESATENQSENAVPAENITVLEENLTTPTENATNETLVNATNVTTEKQTGTISFTDVCEDTCLLPDGLDASNYELIIEVDHSELQIDEVSYSLSNKSEAVNQTNETVFFGTTIVDSNGDAVPATIEFANTKTNAVEAIGKSEKGDEAVTLKELAAKQPSALTEQTPAQTTPAENQIEQPMPLASSETQAPIEEAAGEPGLDIPRGEYNINVKLQNHPIKEIDFENLDIQQNITDFIKIDNPSASGDFVDIYAIDPTQFKFTSATVTGTAVGDSLYKCKDWDFANQICTGDWVFVQSITPGQDYSFVLTPEDPAYAQIPITNCAAEDTAAQNSFGAACTVANGSSLTADDTSYELHTWRRNTTSSYYGGIRINSTNTSVTDCSSLVSVSLCYKWWYNNSGSAITVANISVDANNGASYTVVNTTIPPTSEPTNMTCQNITANESWSCSNFFGASATGALAKAEITRVGAPSANGVGFWDVLFFNVTYTPDTSPNATLVSPANGNVTTSNNVTFSCNATDDIKLSNITFYWNYTGTFLANGTVNASGTSNQTTFNRTNLNNGAILWNCRACDNRSQCSFAPANYTVTINYTVPDTNPPTWSTNQSSFPTQYNASQISIFNITWADNVNISTVLIEGNWSGSPQNYTATLISGTTANGIWSYNATLPAGTFYWKSYANDTNGNPNSTANWTFAINKTAINVNLYLNGTLNSNVTYIYLATVNATGTSTGGIVNVYRDGNLMVSGASPQTNLSNLGNGTYAYKVNATGNANYSDNLTGVTYYAFVNQATSACSLSFNPTSPQTYGTSLNVSCSCTAGTAQLYRNGTNVTTEINSNVTLGVGTYNYTCNITGNANYTSATNSSNYVVNKAATLTRLFLNGTEGNRSYNTGDVANFTVTINASGKTVYLDTNISGWTQQSGVTPLTNITTLSQVGYYNVTGSFPGDTNYTASNVTYYANVTILDTTPPATITGLSAPLYGLDWIYWNWTNPADADFNHAEAWLNGTFKTNTSNNYYNATGLSNSTTYQIQIRTADNAGNVNSTWVNNTAQTLAVSKQQNESIPSANGSAINATLTIINSTGQIVYLQTNTTYSFDLIAGNYTIKISPVNTPTISITYYNYTVDSNFILPGFDKPGLSDGALNIFAVNPLGSFQTANITVNLTGGVLTKCDNYTFAAQTCEEGQWHTIAYGLTPGTLYNITITPGDPGYAEFNGTALTNDTQIYQASANSNYGSITTMIVGKWNAAGRAYRSLIKFNLSSIPSGVRIDKANLTFYVTATDAGARTHNVYKIYDNRTWVELQATWNNYTTGNAWTTAGGDYNATLSTSTGVSITGYYSFNVTNDVQIFADNQSKNQGWIIIDSNEATQNTRKTYTTSNSATANQRPLLQVNWTDIQAPGWSNQSQNASTINNTDSVKLSAYWTDNVNLSYAVLSTNETGAWANKSGVYGSPLQIGPSIGNWSNFTWSNSSVSGIIGWRIWANDTQGNWNVTDIATINVTVPNTAPNTTTPTIDPTTAYKINNLYCNATLTDAEQTSLTAYFTWYKNNAANFSGIKTSITNGTNTNITILTSGNLTKGDNWTCQVIPNDGTVNGTAKNSTNITIQNSVPTISAIAFANNTTGHSFNATVNVTDVDSYTDLSTVTVNSTECTLIASTSINSTTNQTIFRCTNTTTVKALSINITVNDTSNAVASVTGTNTYPNNAPTQPTVTIAPATAYKTDNLNCSVSGSTDSDSDTISYYFNWTNGTTTVLSGLVSQTSFNLSSGNLSKGQTWTCTVIPTDTFVNGTSNSASRTISDSATTFASFTMNDTNHNVNALYSANVTDIDGLSGCKIEHNNTGSSFVNTSFTSLSGNSNWCNITILNNATNNRLVGWYVWVNDSTGTWTKSASQTFTTSNTAPTSTNPTLSNLTPATNTVLTCTNGSFTDVNGDVAAWYYQWYKNNGLISGQVSSALDLSIAGNGDKNDQIICATMASDSIANESTGWRNSSTATVQNTAPTTPTTLTPTTGMYGGTNSTIPINCTGSTDADTDTITYFIGANDSGTWHIINSSTTGAYNWDISALASQVVDINCTAGDGTVNSSSFNPAGTITIDNTKPTWSNNQSSIPLTYSATPSVFNITWADNINVSTVQIDGNWSGSAQNYTAALVSGTNASGVWSYSTTIGAGTYYWKSYANDSVGNTNASAQQTFTVSKADNPVNLYLNGTQANSTYTYPQSINATSTTLIGTVFLYRDATLLASGASPQVNISVLGNGTYAYKVNATGNTNYSDNATGVTYYAFVNKGTSVCNLTFDKTTPQNYSAALTATCSCTANSGTVALYRNGTNVTATENGTAVTLGVSTWAYECNTTGNANYTSATNTSNFVINQATRTCTLATDKNWTRTYDSTSSSTNCTVSAGSSDGSMTFTRNSTSKSSPDAVATAGSYNYACQWTGGVNYSDCTQQTNTLLINKADPSGSLSLYLQSALNNATITYGTPSNATGISTVSQDLTFNLYRNGSFITSGSPATELATLGAGNYVYVYNTTGGTNYTAGSTVVRYLTISTANDFVNLTLNGIQNNVTIPYGANLNASSSSTSGTDQIYRNGTNVTSEKNTNVSLGAGYYQYKANTTGNTNYTANGTGIIYYVTVSQVTSTCSLSFNPTSPQTYGTAINASCSCTNPEASATLYRDGANVTVTENNINTVLAAQAHNYTCNISASQNYTSASNSSNYTITRANPSGNLGLALNGIESDTAITYGTQSNATGWSDLVNNQDLTFNLYGNGILANSGDPASDVQTLAAGNYTYVYNTTGGVNYTAGSSPARLLIVDRAISVLTLSASPGWVVFNGTQTNVSCGTNTPQVTPSFYRNGTSASNPDVQTLSPGNYNYICNNSATQNYTEASTSNTLAVTLKNVSNCYLNFNPTSPQTYPTSVNASCSCTNPESSAKLYRDDADVTATENNVFASLAAGNYSYVCNVTETGNWSTASNSSIYELDPVTTVLSLTASPSWTNTYPTETTVNCSANNAEVTPQLYVNGTFVGIPYTITHAAGTYDYVCNNTASQNYTSESASNTLTINKTSTSTQLYLDGMGANETVTYPSQTNATAVTDVGSVTLYREGSSVSNQDIATLAAGTYNYTAVNLGDENYTGSFETWFLTVNQNTSSCNLAFNPTSPQTYGTAINASCSCTNPEAATELYRDGVDVTSSENNMYTTLAANTYNYVCNTSASQNYTSASTGFSYVINPVTGVIYLYLNGSRANFTTSNNTYVNISAVLVSGTGDMQVYDNGTQIYSGASPSQNVTLFDALGVHNITAEFLGNQNYTAAYETWWINITPPVISNVIAQSITDNSTQILWDTNVFANSTIDYDTTLALGSNITSASFVLSHSLALASLSANTTYFFNVTSCDQYNNCVTSGPYNFTTTSTTLTPSGFESILKHRKPTTNVSAVANETLPGQAGYTGTYYIGDFNFTSVYDYNSSVNESHVFTYDGVNHTITPLQIADNFVDLQIESKVSRLKLGVNESGDVDVTDDGVADVRITLNGIEAGSAYLTVRILEKPLASVAFAPSYMFYVQTLLTFLVVLYLIWAIWRKKKREAEEKEAKRKTR